MAAHLSSAILVCGSASASLSTPDMSSPLLVRLVPARLHKHKLVLMGINRLLGSEGGGALQSGDLRLRQHVTDDLAALWTQLVVSETASTIRAAC